jgi:hypothetical protein
MYFLHVYFPRGQIGPNCPTPVTQETNFIQRKNVRRAGGKGEELWLQSQEDQELSAAAGASQLILKMTSEHQTVDHTNKIMGNDHDHDRCAISQIFQEREDTNFENSVEKTIGCAHLRLDM